MRVKNFPLVIAALAFGALFISVSSEAAYGSNPVVGSKLPVNMPYENGRGGREWNEGYREADQESLFGPGQEEGAEWMDCKACGWTCGTWQEGTGTCPPCNATTADCESCNEQARSEWFENVEQWFPADWQACGAFERIREKLGCGIGPIPSPPC